MRDALTAIAKYAFIASPYPVILSLEVHCDQPQQDKLADILRSTLGPALLDAPLFGEEAVEEHAGCAKVEVLPSPEHLKYRILVKAKNLYVVKAAQKVETPAMDSESSSSASSDSDLKRGKRAYRVWVQSPQLRPEVVRTSLCFGDAEDPAGQSSSTGVLTAELCQSQHLQLQHVWLWADFCSG